MANPEHVKIIKQGVKVWNKWREENPKIKPNLSRSILRRLILNNVNFYETNLSRARFFVSDLLNSNLVKANLDNASLVGTNLTKANLSEATLYGADLTIAILTETNISKVSISNTTFGGTYLINTIGLDSCNHVGPSTIDFRTIQRSSPLPSVFLRGCGLPENYIESLPTLLEKPLQFYSCFISYSSKDNEFAKLLHENLQDKGVRCWFAPEDMKIGDRFRSRIDEAIQFYDKLLLILSENSINSQWVEKEVETAFEREKKEGIVLFPIRLDNTIMETDQAWAADIRRTRHIGDFRDWKDPDKYQKAFERLLGDLKLENRK